MIRSGAIAGILALSACVAPSFDATVADRLASVEIGARQLAARCPHIAADDVRARLAVPLAVTAEETRYRPNAGDITAAIGEMRAMTATLEDAARDGMSPTYCTAKLADIADGADRILRVYEGL